MPVPNYSLVVGPLDGYNDKDRDRSPHLKLYIDAGSGGKEEAPINMASTQKPYPLLVRVEGLGYKLGPVPDEPLSGETQNIINKLSGVGPGIYEKGDFTGVDYVRGLNLKQDDFTPVPALSGSMTLFDVMVDLVKEALDEPTLAYVFGSRYPGGIHDIHMNQGNRGGFRRDNGAYTDGCLLLHFTKTNRWIAFYSAFQSQSFNTDTRGNPLGDAQLLGRMFALPPSAPLFRAKNEYGHDIPHFLRTMHSPASEVTDEETSSAEYSLISLLKREIQGDAEYEAKKDDKGIEAIPQPHSPEGSSSNKGSDLDNVVETKHQGDVEFRLRERAATTLANMQLGLPYAAPFAAFGTFGDFSKGDFVTREQVAKLVVQIRSFIHSTCSKAHTSMTIGLNLGLWEKWLALYPDLKTVRGMVSPEELDRVLSRADHVYKNSEGLIWCHVKSDQRKHVGLVVNELQVSMKQLHGLDPRFPVVYTESRGGVQGVSCPHPVGRVLGARFAENLQNPGSPVDVLECTLVGEEDPVPTHHGGSFVFAQQFRVNWGMLHSAGDTMAEDLVGRKAHTDEFLPSLETDSHIKCSHVQDQASGDTVRILRLGQPFGRRQVHELGTLADEAGIYFAGFANSANALLKVVRSQIGPHDGFVRDRLLQSGVSSTLGGLYYAPSLSDLGLGINRKVLRHAELALDRQHEGQDAWHRFPGIDWGRLPRHFLEPKKNSNDFFFRNHHEYMYTMCTAPASELNRLRPPSLRILNLASKVFGRWQDSWYRGRMQQEMSTLRVYAKDFFALRPEAIKEVTSAQASPEEAADALMAQPVVTRKAWAVRLACGFVFTDKEYGKRGLLNQQAVTRSDQVGALYGADTFHMHPLEVIVGGMPNLSLGQGKFMIDYATPDEAWPNFFSGISYASGVGHVVPDYTEVLKRGTAVVIEELEAESEKTSVSGDLDAMEFFRASSVALRGVQEHAGAFAKLASETKHRFKHNLESPEYCNLVQVEATMVKLSRGEPPSTLREAAQLIFTLHSCLHLIGEPVAIGRLDQALEPFYDPHSVDASFQAQEIIDAFFLKLADKTMFNRQFFVDHQPPGHLAMGNASGPYPQGGSFNQWVQQLTVGGQKDDGSPAFNDLTVFFIRASRRLPVNSPVLSLRLYKADRELLRPYVEEAAIALLSGGATPVLLNDDKIIPGLQKSMVQSGRDRKSFLIPIEHARNYACDGCYEPMFVGRNWFMLGGFPVLKAVEYAINQGLSLFDAGPTFIHGKAESFRSEPAQKIKTFDHLMDLFYRHFEWTYAKQVQEFVTNFGRVSKTCPAPLLSVFIKGCRERARDLYNGGAEYNVVGPCFTGLANAINSLWAIKVLCFEAETALVSLPELVQCLACDWGNNMTDPFFQPRLGAERIAKVAEKYRHIRKHALQLSRWGRGEASIDEFGNGVCREVADRCRRLFDNAPVHEFSGLRESVQELADRPDLQGMGHVCIQPGVGTFEGYVSNGLGLAASADGRGKGTPLATDMSPSPTPGTQPEVDILEAMKGVSSCDGFAFWNGAPVDKNIDEDFPLDKLIDVVYSFAEGAGSNIMTVTVANECTFSAAMDCPERYDCVRVRTGGWTEYFAALPLAHQQVHIDRPRDRPQA